MIAADMTYAGKWHTKWRQQMTISLNQRPR